LLLRAAVVSPKKKVTGKIPGVRKEIGTCGGSQFQFGTTIGTKIANKELL
jgi:hypothetical protein